MKALFSIVTAVSLFLGDFEATAQQTPIQVPAVSISNFPVGATWTWDYFDPTGKIYSTERYTVLAQKNQNVLIELATDYDGGQDLKPNHRLLVDVSKCLHAYSNPVQKKPWRYTMYYLNQGRWTELDQPNTLAFEEKFNCNAHVYAKPSAPYLTEFKIFEGQQVFSQKLWRRIEGSWYAASGPNQAITLTKTFAAEPGQNYSMKLRAHTSP